MMILQNVRAARLAIGVLALSGLRVHAQASMAPVNDKPNPYETIVGWAKLPAGRTWGSTSAVEIDRDGKTVWVAERCGANSCAGSNLPPVLHFDEDGNLIKAFGEGMITSPHGIFVDRDGNIWVTDCSCTGGGGGRGRRGGGGSTGSADSAGRAGGGAAPPEQAAPPKGHQVFKFSPDGTLLMTLGKAGGGRDPEFFTQPNDVLVAPSGDIFVSEGHSSAPGTTARILKFSKDGKPLASWGGVVDSSANGLDQPHALAMDSRGRLFVGDRGNNRIKIFSQDGKLLDTWYQFSRPSGIYIDKNDNIYVADSESGGVDRTERGRAWKRGIRIGSAKDGSVKYLIPDPLEICAPGQQSTAEAPCSASTSAAEGVAVDAKGNVYGAEVGPRALKRYVKK